MKIEIQCVIKTPQHYKQYCICELCYKYRDMVLTKEYLDNASAQELHQFEWIDENEIAEIPIEYNHLVGVYENKDNINYDLSVHYLYYNDCNEKKCYEIDPYETFEETCAECNEMFYCIELFQEHKCM